MADAGRQIQRESGRILERPLVEAAGFKRRGDAARSTAGPAKDAIERVPPVIEQNAASPDLEKKLEALARELAGGLTSKDA